MFTCSICSDTFVGTHHTSTYATPCGHVFHHECLMAWLQRSPTCPHCRSSVSEDNIKKLFLQVDHSLEILDKKMVEEIKELKETLKSVKEKQTSFSNSVEYLEVQLNNKNIELSESCKSVEYLKKKAETEKKNKSKMSTELKLMTEQYNSSEIERKKLKSINLLLDSKTKSLNHEIYELQSSNSSNIDGLKLEIAHLKSKTAYFQGQCQYVERINIEQPSTSKMNIKNKNSSLLQNEYKIENYEPDPQSHLSTKKFLSGCVFLFVEVESQHEDFNILCNNTIIYKKKIIQHGGSVEQNYSVGVTHVICVTQKHHLVERGIHDGKRCVTGYWLVDILAKESMIPPWLAIHFPIPYSLEKMPCKNIKFSIFYFGINERQIIISMIKLVGGSHEAEITSRTDIIVSQKLEDELIDKIWEVNKPVVNVQWLNDILFGDKLGKKNLKNSKYKEFDVNDPFLVNLNMVSRLMDAWKTPLILWMSQRMYTLPPDSSIRCKRQKTSDETKENPFFHLNDEDSDNSDDSNDNDVVITYVKSIPFKPCVLFSGVSADNRAIFQMMINFFGGSVARHFSEVTHLVMSKPVTSIEFFGCLSTVKYIVNEDWLRSSHSSLRLLDEKDYLIKYVQNQSLGLCNITAIIENKKRHLLFRYLSFFVTPGIKYPPPLCLKQIIYSAGGTVESARRSLESIQGLAPNTYFIISCLEDHSFYNDLLHISNVVYFPEFITCSVLAQQVQLLKFLLKITA